MHFIFSHLLSSTAFAESLPGQAIVSGAEGAAGWGISLAEMIFAAVITVSVIVALTMLLVPSLRTKGFAMLGCVVMVMIVISVMAFFKFSSFGMDGSLAKTIGLGIKK